MATLFDQVATEVSLAEATTYIVVGHRVVDEREQKKSGGVGLSAMGLRGFVELGQLLGMGLRNQFGDGEATEIVTALLAGIEMGFDEAQ